MCSLLGLSCKQASASHHTPAWFSKAHNSYSGVPVHAYWAEKKASNSCVANWHYRQASPGRSSRSLVLARWSSCTTAPDFSTSLPSWLSSSSISKSAATGAPSTVRAQYQSLPLGVPLRYHLWQVITDLSGLRSHRNQRYKSPLPEPASAKAYTGTLPG